MSEFKPMVLKGHEGIEVLARTVLVSENKITLKTGHTVYCNQYETAAKVMDAFNAGHDYVIVIAPPQSGKSGVARAFFSDFVTNNPNKHYLCAYSDKSFRKQIEKDLAGCCSIINKYDELNDSNNFGLNPAPGYHVYDEVHHGTGINSIEAKQMIRSFELGSKVLALTATPANMLNIGTEGKNPYIIIMKPSHGHRGVEYWLSKENLQFFNNAGISSNFESQLFREALLWLLVYGGYGVVRIALGKKGKAQLAIIKRLASSLKIKVENWHNEVTSYSKDELSVRRPRPTLVIIYERFTMGCQIPKEHIAFWWERDRNANDSTIQSFRMCGYDVHDNLRLYANKEHFVSYLEHIQQPTTPVSLTKPLKNSNFTKIEKVDNGKYVSKVKVFDDNKQIEAEFPQRGCNIITPENWNTEASLVKINQMVKNGGLATGYKGSQNSSKSTRYIKFKVTKFLIEQLKKAEFFGSVDVFSGLIGKFVVSYYQENTDFKKGTPSAPKENRVGSVINKLVRDSHVH